MIFLKRGINMKSKGILLLVLIFLLLIVFVGCSEDNSTSNKLESSCSSDEVTKTNNNSKEYTKIDGYDEYIATGNTGYEDIQYFNINNDIPNEKAYEYYKKNKRVVGNYIITDYENGVCLNKINKTPEEDSEIKIVTDIGELEFHDFLIKHQSEPEVKDVVFSNVSTVMSVDSGVITLAGDLTISLSTVKYFSYVDIDARGFLHSALPTDHYVKGAESVTFSLLGLLNSEADLGLCCFHCVCAFLGCFRLQRYTLFLN